MTGEKWFSGDPYDVADNPAGLEGEWYSFGNPDVCPGVGPDANPCTAEGCCFDWAWTDPEILDWNCGLGLTLNTMPGRITEAAPYLGPALGFNWVIEHDAVSVLGTIRYLQSRSGTTPAENYLTRFSESGEYLLPFSELGCGFTCDDSHPEYATAISTTAVEVMVKAGDWPTGRLCVTSLRPLL